jgi:hypothetical protein
MKIIEIKIKDREYFQERIEALEKIAEYPLGNDFFKISHGSDYFNFFDRLGDTHYFVCLVDAKVVAVACGIIRYLEKPIFYLCDLKVHPDYRGKHLPLKILFKAAFLYYLKCPRGYAISMDHQNQKENRVAKLLKKFWILPFNVSTQILIYSFSFEQVTAVQSLIEKHKGNISFLSLKGIKDLVLKSTQMPMPILHIQYGKNAAQGRIEPLENHVHMLALSKTDQLVSELSQINIFPNSTATLISHNAKNYNWDFVQTSDI